MRDISSVLDIVDQYDAVLLDAYGVLINSSGACAGAVPFMNALKQRRKPFSVVTNDASSSPDSISDRFARLGLPIAPRKFVTSGMLLHTYFTQNDLCGKRCAVLGTADSKEYVRDAGGVLVSPADDFEVLVVADEHGYPFLTDVDGALSSVFRAHSRGERPALVLPNPDLIYPKGDHEFGMAAGGIALFFEAALHRKLRVDWEFERLGKPYAPIFSLAQERYSSQRLLMVGDQLETDVLGAQQAGIDSVLILGGITSHHWVDQSSIQPTYLTNCLV